MFPPLENWFPPGRNSGSVHSWKTEEKQENQSFCSKKRGLTDQYNIHVFARDTEEDQEN
jgi:hypothetical protein